MDNRALLALTLSFFLLIFYQAVIVPYYMPSPSSSPPSQTQQEESPKPEKSAGVTPIQREIAPAPPSRRAVQKEDRSSQKKDPSVSLETDLMRAEVSLKGGRLVDLHFLSHLDQLGAEGKAIRFLKSDGMHSFMTETGFLSSESGLLFPDKKTLWRVVEVGERHVRMQWDNGEGLLFERSIEAQNDGYLFSIYDRIVNHTGQPISLYHYGQYTRAKPVSEGGGMSSMAIVDYEGPMAFLNGEREQHAYEDIQNGDIYIQSRTGWTGFSDKYFLAALIPEDNNSVKRFYFDYDAPFYRVGEVGQVVQLESDHTVESGLKLYIGPKAVRDLENSGLDLDRSIDYGWFHFIAHPLMELLLFFYAFLGNFGLSIILLTVLIKIIFFPLANKSYRSMNAMKKLQPKIEHLRKIHGEDKMRLNQEMMKLYQDNKVNPLGGCLPIVVQIPVFFALYKVLFLSIEMRHAPFFLWIHDLSAQDPFYVLPVVMGISMFLQSKLNPTPADPIQAKIMMFLPVIFTFLFLQFPSGLVLYWVVNNVLSILQQYYIMKRTP